MEPAGGGSSESKSSEAEAAPDALNEARKLRLRIDVTVSNNMLLRNLRAIDLPEVAKELRGYTNGLAEGDSVAARRHCEAALRQLKEIPAEFERGRDYALQAGQSIVNLLKLPNDVGRSRLEADYYEKRREEYAALRAPPEPGRLGPPPREAVAFEVIKAKYPTLRSLSNEEILARVRLRSQYLLKVPDETLERFMVQEADYLVPAKGGSGLDDLLRPRPLLADALEALAKETTPTLHEATQAETLGKVRSAISASPDAWPGWLHGVWSASGKTYVAVREETLRFWKLGSGFSLGEVGSDDAAEAMMVRLKEEFARNSTSEAKLLAVMPAGTDVLMTDGAVTLRFSPLEWRLLLRGHPLPDRPDLTNWLHYLRAQALVVYSHPMMLCAGPYRDLADGFCFGFQKAYPQLRVYRDPFSATTAKRAEALNHLDLGRPSDYVAVIAEDSFRVVDANVIQDIRGVLTNAGIEVATYRKTSAFTWRATGSKGVIVITGHSSDELAAFIKDLGDSGALRGNFVIFNSCQTAVTRELATRMVEDYGAQAVFVHRGIIRAATVQALMVDFAKSLKQPGSQALPDRLRSLLNAHGLGGVWTISMNSNQPNLLTCKRTA